MRDLQRRGLLKIPRNDVEVQTDKKGFIDLSGSGKSNLSSNKNVEFSSETEGYNKKEVDSKIFELDNKIYKLEQRIELIERKVGVGEQNNSGGFIGW